MYIDIQPVVNGIYEYFFYIAYCKYIIDVIHNVLVYIYLLHVLYMSGEWHKRVTVDAVVVGSMPTWGIIYFPNIFICSV